MARFSRFSLLVGGFSAATLLAACAVDDNTMYTACPVGVAEEACDFTGDDAIQKAIDAVVDGGVVTVKAGTYSTVSTRDAPFQEPYPDYMRDVMVRGMLMVEDKRVTIIGDGDVTLTGNPDIPASAIVVHDGGLRLENITLTNFRVGEPEDPIYDGHGIFIMDSTVALKNVKISGLDKMALVARGATTLSAEKIDVRTSHMGLWLEEEGLFTLKDSVIADNHTGLGMYGNTKSVVSNTLIENNSDDGVYALGNAEITLVATTVTGNKPLGLNVRENAKLTYESGKLSGNEKDVSEALSPTAITFLDVVQLPASE